MLSIWLSFSLLIIDEDVCKSSYECSTHTYSSCSWLTFNFISAWFWACTLLFSLLFMLAHVRTGYAKISYLNYIFLRWMSGDFLLIFFIMIFIYTRSNKWLSLEKVKKTNQIYYSIFFDGFFIFICCIVQIFAAIMNKWIIRSHISAGFLVCQLDRWHFLFAFESLISIIWI